MTTKTVLFALMAMWGVGLCGTAPTVAEDAATTSDSDSDVAAEAEASLTGRVWVRADGSDDLPGTMQVFLDDGTLVTDSCWETYRLSAWKYAGTQQAISWNEDGAEIKAEIKSLTASELVLRLDLGSDSVEQRFTAAKVPYVCPDMPKS